jgi:hypothetical protein
MKLTKAQTKALQTIAENPGQVSNLGGAHDNAKGRLTVHGTTGSNLLRQRLIEVYNPENGRSYDEDTDGSDISPWYSGTYRYRLTEAGYEAIGQTTTPKIEDGHSAMDSLRDMLKLH